MFANIKNIAKKCLQTSFLSIADNKSVTKMQNPDKPARL